MMQEIALIAIVCWFAISAGFWSTYQPGFLRRGRTESFYDYVLNLIIAMIVGPILAFLMIWRRF